MPYEEKRCVKEARHVLRGLLDMSPRFSCDGPAPKTKKSRIQWELKALAMCVLRHYPPDYRIDELYSQDRKFKACQFSNPKKRRP